MYSVVVSGYRRKRSRDVVGASPTTISNLEQGKLGTIHIDHLVALAHHLNVSTDYLPSG